MTNVVSLSNVRTEAGQAGYSDEFDFSAGKYSACIVGELENGSLNHQRVFAGHLNALGDLILSHDIKNPALILIGEVARPALAQHADQSAVRAAAG